MHASLRLTLACVVSVQVAIGAGPAAAQLVLLDSFDAGTGQLAGGGFDATQDRVWVYGSSDADILSFDRTGTSPSSVARPGEAANDVDVEIAPDSVNVGGTVVPTGTLLFINGESGTADIYALDPSDGTVLATLVTAFGNNHVVGGAWHRSRETFFLVTDQLDSTPSTIAEINPITGAVIDSFSATITVNFGDLDADVVTGNLFLATDANASLRELTPTGDVVQDHPWPMDVTGISGLGLDEGRNEIWAASTNGTVYRVGFGTPTTTTTSSSTTTTTVTTTTTAPPGSTTTTTTTPASTTTTTSSTTTTTTSSTSSSSTSTTSTTLAAGATFLPGKKLLVKRKKSGLHRLQLLAKDPSITPPAPCEQDGELVVESVGAGTAPRRFPLDASLWKPIKAKKPEKGCKYRKGPVVATVQVKAGKMLKVVANGADLGVPLATDPRPVRIELRHGAARWCLEFGGEKGQHKADKKLLAKNAAPAAACPTTPAAPE